MTILHKCEDTVSYWRAVPAMLAPLVGIVGIVNFQIGDTVHNVLGAMWSIVCVWMVAGFWLGHPALPKKWR